jgi:sigma-B regulation protein RsbU (phosphoserine phosphatase)
MLMVQSVVAALAGQARETKAKDLVIELNRVLVENIRNRLETDEHVTFAILHCHADGQVRGAGAHEYVILIRQDTGEYELIATRGPWVGVTDGIDSSIREFSFELRRGDLMVLYSDGITEAMNGANEQFQVKRLCDQICAHRHESATQILDGILLAVDQWTTHQDDDRTLLVARYIA